MDQNPTQTDNPPVFTHSDVHRLAYDGKEILLIGTAHVSQESADLVRSVIEAEKPDTVCIELCSSRLKSMVDKDHWRNTDIVKVIREKKASLLLLNLILASFQRRIGDKFKIKPGEEMLQAVKAADAVGAQVVPSDRDIRVTLTRTWRLMGLWSKIKLLFDSVLSFSSVDEITAEDIEKLKKQDMLETVLTEIGKELPEIRSVLIDERDRYLTAKIRTAPGTKIVAVVGAGHVPGIKNYWDKPVNTDELDQLPPKGKVARVLKWGIPVLIMGLIVSGFFHAGAKVGVEMITWWVIAHGVLAGLGALVALARPLTILSAIGAAPLTALNPMIAAGWVSGLVEAISRKPTVLDFERLSQDIGSFKGFWRNNITRILLVVVFTNIGSSFGTFVALPLMIKAFS